MRGFIVMGIMKNLIGSTPRRSSVARTETNGSVEVQGFTENLAMFEHMMTKDAALEKRFRSIIRYVLKKERNNLSKDARSVMKSDPRKASRAVKFAVYKKMFGGNLSILQKRSHGALSKYERPRKLRGGQRGGNRRARSNDNRNRLEKYYGADRGFILRFLNSGTVERETRYGKRGSIRRTGWFARTAPWHIDSAARDIADGINEYIKLVSNGQ